MASAIDSALLATQTYKARKPAAGTRPRGPAADTQAGTPATAIPGQHSRPAVALSLSAEALQVLSGTRDTERQARPKESEDQTPRTAESEAAKPGEGTFETLVEQEPRQREAPFAHLPRDESPRLQIPGSRLDITI